MTDVPNSPLDEQYVYRQRLIVEVIWATAAPDDAFDDAMSEALSSIAERGAAIIWRVAPGPVERMGKEIGSEPAARPSETEGYRVYGVIRSNDPPVDTPSDEPVVYRPQTETRL